MHAQTTPERLLSRSQVAERLGICTETLRRWERQGTGPRVLRAGPRVLRYRLSDVESWLDQTGDPR